MSEDERLQEFLNHCHERYLRLVQDGQWPWANSDNSTDSEAVVESENQ